MCSVVFKERDVSSQEAADCTQTVVCTLWEAVVTQQVLGAISPLPWPKRCG